MGEVVNYREWEAGISPTLTQDALWKVTAYRRALFAADLGWSDVTALTRDRRTVSLADQLYRALGSISANVAEGYSRGGVKDRARFYEYALGSARESRDWYFKGRHLLGDPVVEHRMQLLTEIIRLLLRMVPDERGYRVGEASVSYHAEISDISGALPTVSAVWEKAPLLVI
jgi:four helix bundle protein